MNTNFRNPRESSPGLPLRGIPERRHFSRISRFPSRLAGVLDIVDRDRGIERRLAPIFIGDLGGELDLAGGVVERLDYGGVFLRDKGTADLASASDLIVVGVKLLVEQHEATDARGGGQRRVAFPDLLTDQLAHLRFGAEILERGVSEVVPFSPIA